MLEKIRQKENKWWALGFSLLFCGITALFFDYYYAINDDMLMKDMLAGIYTGVPEGRNIQMLFPIGWFISLFYRVARNVPWYGIFFCVCHFGCICLIAERLLGFFQKRLVKAAVLVLEAVLLTALFLYELVFAQYTVTSGLLAATAAFLFYTADASGTVRQFFKRNLVSIFLVIIAFQIRTEMLLLLLPLICVTGLCKWAAETLFFTKENAQKYFCVFGAILAGMVVSVGINALAYSSPQWQQFNRFFDNRTELYDFLSVPHYEGNEAFYDSIGLTKSEQKLLENYNFGLDEEIDDVLLGRICDYVKAGRGDKNYVKYTLVKAAKEYVYRTTHLTDFPWNVFVIVLYGMVLIAALGNRHFRFVWELVCMGIVRTGLWMFILYRGRSPERIVHPLYLMELMILLAMLLTECRKEGRRFTWIPVAFAGVLLVMGIASLPSSVEKVSVEYEKREVKNKELEALQDYTRAHADNFYFVEVYSWAFYSQKMFHNVDNRIINYDIMGGWGAKSPLTAKKLEYFQIPDMEQGLLRKNVFVISEEADMSWLTEYYKDQGMEVQVQKADAIYVEGQEVLAVYFLQKQ